MIKVIGLTGQTGAGKGAVCDILKSVGIDCIDCDLVAREVVKPEKPALKELCRVFGKEILQQSGELDRKKLGAIVFSDKEKLKLLNDTIFPFIIKEIKELIQQIESVGKNVVVLDAPTLFESGCDALCAQTIAVTADKNLRLERIVLRDGLSKEEAERRINSQLEEEFFRSNCDIIIENNGDLQKLEESVKSIVENWRAV